MQAAKPGYYIQYGEGRHHSEDPHPDLGCDVAPKCLECPVPNGCKYDDPVGCHQWRKRQWDEAIVELRRTLTPEEVAALKGVNTRSVNRAVQRVLGKCAPGQKREGLAKKKWRWGSKRDAQ